MYVNNFVVTMTSAVRQISSTNTFVKFIMLQAGSANSASVYTGGPLVTAVNGAQINAREVETIASDKDDLNLSTFYVIGSTGDVVRVKTISGG